MYRPGTKEAEIKCSKPSKQTKCMYTSAEDYFEDFHVAKTFLPTASAISGGGSEPQD
jgi:hypothetical protein